jgi:hypothetical protein
MTDGFAITSPYRKHMLSDRLLPIGFFIMGAMTWLVTLGFMGVKLYELIGFALLLLLCRRPLRLQYSRLWILLFFFAVFSYLLSLTHHEFYPLSQRMLYQPYIYNIARGIRILLLALLAALAVEQEVRKYAAGFMWGGLLLVLMSLPLYFAGNAHVHVEGGLFKIIGSFESGPGGTMVALAAICASMALRGLFRYAVIGVFCIALVLSQSSSGFVTLSVWLLTVFLLNKNIALVYKVALLPIAAGAFWYFYPAIELKVDRYLFQYVNPANVETERARYLAGRHGITTVAPQMVAAHPYLGIGFGNFMNVRNAPEYLGDWPETRLDWDDLSCDVATVLVEQGGVGFALALALSVLYLRRARQKDLAAALLATTFVLAPLVMPWWWMLFRRSVEGSSEADAEPAGQVASGLPAGVALERAAV